MRCTGVFALFAFCFITLVAAAPTTSSNDVDSSKQEVKMVKRGSRHNSSGHLVFEDLKDVDFHPGQVYPPNWEDMPAGEKSRWILTHPAPPPPKLSRVELDTQEFLRKPSKAERLSGRKVKGYIPDVALDAVHARFGRKKQMEVRRAAAEALQAKEAQKSLEEQMMNQLDGLGIEKSNLKQKKRERYGKDVIVDDGQTSGNGIPPSVEYGGGDYRPDGYQWNQPSSYPSGGRQGQFDHGYSPYGYVQQPGGSYDYGGDYQSTYNAMKQEPVQDTLMGYDQGNPTEWQPIPVAKSSPDRSSKGNRGKKHRQVKQETNSEYGQTQSGYFASGTPTSTDYSTAEYGNVSTSDYPQYYRQQQPYDGFSGKQEHSFQYGGNYAPSSEYPMAEQTTYDGYSSPVDQSLQQWNPMNQSTQQDDSMNEQETPRRGAGRSRRKQTHYKDIDMGNTDS